jgi:Na+:H+ antiporter, NhaA family
LHRLASVFPFPQKVFLTAPAIIDEMGAILVIAVFYSASLSMVNLLIASGIIAILMGCNRSGIDTLVIYLLGGILLWYSMHQSGVHATISGVILAFLIPFREGDHGSPSYQLPHRLHYPMAFLVLPLFALANTSLSMAAGWYKELSNPNSLGIALGLILGKASGHNSFLSGWCVDKTVQVAR